MMTAGIPSDILDDLASRFIINVPEEERKNLIRICFQLELAHWFYLDFYCWSNNNGSSSSSAAAMKSSLLKSCNMREFSHQMFGHINFLRVHVNDVDHILEDWKEYKLAVPTYGAIILNQDLSHVLLVQGFWSKNSWGFPKGKVNEDELPHLCAIREVLEETGFDISPIIDPEEFLETVINDQTVRLYVIPGVPRNTKFVPQTRCEIKDVQWFQLVDLPSSKKDQIAKNLKITHNGLFMVMPFVKPLRKWISRYLMGQSKQKMNAMAGSREDSITPKSTKKKEQRRSRSRNTLPQQNIHSSQTPHRKNLPSSNIIQNEDYIPHSWGNFSINRKEIMSALTYGWS